MSPSKDTNDPNADTGSKIGSTLKSFTSGLKGAGDAIRSTANDTAGEAKDHSVTEKGMVALKQTEE
jgi:hypothetical protein